MGLGWGSARRIGLPLPFAGARFAHLPAQHRPDLLQGAAVRGCTRDEDRPVHPGMLQPPMAAASPGGGEALPPETAEHLVRATAC